MSKKPESAAPAAPHEAASSGGTDQLGSLLLNVLRNIDRQAQRAQALGGAAADAVAHFNAISAELFVLPENAIADSATGLSGGRR